MEKVNIILSTYNGGKYLSEQLDSLFGQTYHNIDIYIRDDGSVDNTKEIIKTYEKKEVQGIKIYYLEDEEGNLGYVKSFLKIIRASGKADFYAFCDQDDIWCPDKIERAVCCLSRYDNQKCLLYSSAYDVCDSRMNVIKSGHIPSMFEKLNVGKALSLYDGGCLLGFTCVFNYTLKKIAFDNDADDMYSHDIWVQAVAVGMGGKFYYDEKVTAHFRRHDNTTSIAESEVDSSFVNAWKYRWNEMFGNGQVFNRIRGSIDSYFRLFYESVSGKEDKEFLLKFGQNKKGAASVFGKLFYRYRLKQSLLTEIAWRIAILFGKI